MALLLAGCASAARTPQALQEMPDNKVWQVRETVNAPLDVAYRNLLANARACWRNPTVVEEDPFDEKLGYARISVRLIGDALIEGSVTGMVTLFPDGAGATRLEARSLPMLNRLNFENLAARATGQKRDCDTSRQIY
jgi:hypothetical protein